MRRTDGTGARGPAEAAVPRCCSSTRERGEPAARTTTGTGAEIANELDRPRPHSWRGLGHRRPNPDGRRGGGCARRSPRWQVVAAEPLPGDPVMGPPLPRGRVRAAGARRSRSSTASCSSSNAEAATAARRARSSSVRGFSAGGCTSGAVVHVRTADGRGASPRVRFSRGVPRGRRLEVPVGARSGRATRSTKACSGGDSDKAIREELRAHAEAEAPNEMLRARAHEGRRRCFDTSRGVNTLAFPVPIRALYRPVRLVGDRGRRRAK